MPNASTSGWSKADDATILRLRDDKVTCVQMGRAVGRSGAAVAGRLQRLGVAKVRIFLTPEERKRRKAAYNLDYKRGLAPVQIRHRAVTVAELANVEPLHVSLIDLPDNGCKWPYGDGPFTFCGCDRLEDKPYCYPHHMQATQPERERRMAA